MPQDVSSRGGIKKYLKAAGKSWKDSKEYHEENFGKKVSSGDCIALLIEMSIGVNDERLIVKPKWLVQEGDCEGYNVYGDTLWLHTPGAQAFFRDWCIKIDEESPDDLEDELEDFCKATVKKGIFCTLRVKYKDEEVDSFPSKVAILSREHDYDPPSKSTKDKEKVVDGGSDGIDDMSKKELVRFVEDNNLEKTIKDYEDLGKKDLLAAIQEAQSSTDSSGAGFGDLSKKELVKHIEDNELDKKIKDYEDLSRKELITALENLNGGGGGGGGIDLADMSMKELVKLVEDEELDKKIKDYEDLGKKDLMEAIVNTQSGGGSDTESKDVEVSLDGFEEFCEYCTISPKAKDKKSKSGMIKFLKNFEFTKEDKLKPRHIGLLEGLGLEDLIVG